MSIVNNIPKVLFSIDFDSYVNIWVNILISL